eukprot:3512870-Rhodomonas_salina.1
MYKWRGVAKGDDNEHQEPRVSTTARLIDPKSSRGTDPLAPEEHPDKIRANNGQGSCRPWVMPYEERNLAHTPQPPLPPTPCQPLHLHTHCRRLLAKGVGGAVGATWCLQCSSRQHASSLLRRRDRRVSVRNRSTD